MSAVEQISETCLVQQSLGGDTRAFEEIVRRHLSAVSATAYALTGNSASSEDVAQETFLTAWQRLGQLEHPEKLRAWLCAIARNTARSLGRKTGNDPLHQADQIEDCHLRSSTVSADERAIIAERERIVWSAISRIPEDYRLPLVLYYRQGLSTGEVAASLELSEEAVRQRLSRARAMLRRDIAAYVDSSLQTGGPSPLLAGVIVAAIGTSASHVSAGAILAGTSKAGAGISGAAGAAITAAVLGPLIGIAGGLYGSWQSIKNAKSEAERELLKRATWQAFALVIVWLAALFGTIYLGIIGVISPKQSATIGAVNLAVYIFMLVWIIGRTNGAIAALTPVDANSAKPQRGNARFAEQATKAPRQFLINVLSSFGGGVFGSLAWVCSTAALSQSWAMFWITAAFAALAMTAGVRRTLRHPSRYWVNCAVVMVAIGAYVGWALWFFWSPSLEQVFLQNNDWIELSPAKQIVIGIAFYPLLAACAYGMHLRGKRREK